MEKENVEGEAQQKKEREVGRGSKSQSTTLSWRGMASVSFGLAHSLIQNHGKKSNSPSATLLALPLLLKIFQARWAPRGQVRQQGGYYSLVPRQLLAGSGSYIGLRFSRGVSLSVASTWLRCRSSMELDTRRHSIRCVLLCKAKNEVWGSWRWNLERLRDRYSPHCLPHCRASKNYALVFRSG